MTRGYGPGWMKDTAAKPIYNALRESQTAHGGALTGGALTAWKRQTIADLKEHRKSGGFIAKLMNKVRPSSGKGGLFHDLGKVKGEDVVSFAKKAGETYDKIKNGTTVEKGGVLGKPIPFGLLPSVASGVASRLFGGSGNGRTEPPGGAVSGRGRVGVAPAIPYAPPQTSRERRGDAIVDSMPAQYAAARQRAPTTLNVFGQPSSVPGYRKTRTTYEHDGGLGCTGIRADSSSMLATCGDALPNEREPGPQHTVIYNIGGAEGPLEPMGVPPTETAW